MWRMRKIKATSVLSKGSNRWFESWNWGMEGHIFREGDWVEIASS